MEDFLREYLPKLVEYRGRLLGSIIGLISGLLWAFLGFWKAIAFLICVFLGYFIGKKIDQRGSLRDLLSRILPPND